MNRIIMPARSMRTEVICVAIALVVAVSETFHPLLNHMWVLMAFSITSYMAHLRASGVGAIGGLCSWFWAWRYPIATLVLFALCAMFDQAIGDDGYVSLACIAFAILGSLLIRRSAKRSEKFLL